MNGSEENKLTPSNSQLHLSKWEKLVKNTSIDKLRVTGDFPIGQVGELVSCKDKNLHFNLSDDWDTFRGYYQATNGEKVHFEYNSPRAIATKSSNTWIEFNPNKFPLNELETLRLVLFQFMNDCKMTRADIAFDILANLSNYKVYKRTPLVQRFFYGRKSEIETIYLGSPVSDNHIKIYNKKLELLKNENIEIEDDDLWRLEITLKSKKIYDLKTALKNFELYLPYFQTIEKPRDRAMLYYLNEYENEWQNLSDKARAKYRRMIRETQSFYLTNYLRDVLNHESERLVSEMNNFLEMFNNAKKISLKPTKLK